MKKIVTLLLTLALCLPMVMTTSLEVRAEDEITYTCSHPYNGDSGTEYGMGCGNTVEASNTVCDACQASDKAVSYSFDPSGTTHNKIVRCGRCVATIGDNAVVLAESQFDVVCTFDSGNTCVCGRVKQTNACRHSDMCHGTADEVGGLCDTCTDALANAEEGWAMGNDLNSHIPMKVCSCTWAELDMDREESCTYDEDGYCTVCTFNPSLVVPSGPCQGEKPAAPSVTSDEEIYAQKAAEREEKMKKEVTTANGEAVKTEIAGVYEVFSLSGTAVTTPKEDVKKAIGLSEEEIKAGTKPSIYMTDYVEPADRDALKNAATSKDKKVLNMLISDMYSITKNGKITKLHSSKEPVSLMFGIPKEAVKADRIYSIICVTRDGSVVELEDTDKDPSTITVDTTVFGKYAIVY